MSETKDRFLPGEKVRYRDTEWNVLVTYDSANRKYVTLENDDGVVTVLEEKVQK